MLDIKALRDNAKSIIERLNTRGEDFSYLYDVVKQDKERRELIQSIEKTKANKNAISKKIGAFKREGKDVSEILNSIEEDKQSIQTMQERLNDLDHEIKDTLLKTPNVPHQNIPLGKDEDDNLEIKTYGEIPHFDFEVKPHWELGKMLDILDFERASKIAASRFVVYKKQGARLERALINFMLDFHISNHGYEEVMLPFIVNEASMTASGQFPKFKADAFELNDDRKLYLNPTAEVPSINLHRDEILKESDLPIHYAAFTTAFRQEAGSAGRDTRGILRQHQFNKVELIKFVKPETSYDELESMLLNSEAILKALEIPYRVVELCSGDIGFGMAKTYDIEVYLPSYQTYREIGSISNAEDFQARRGNIRFKRDASKGAEYVHTLNGSGLAVGRTVIAIMENYQQEDGTILVPKVLQPYMKTDIIK